MHGATPEERFVAKIDKSDDGCWNWTNVVSGTYGRFYVDGKHVQAHRFSYELYVGPIPDGLDLDHLCRNRLCVNPAHLEPVTRQENILRGCRARGQKTHCVNGHEYTPENTYTSANSPNHRFCRACALNSSRRAQNYQGNPPNALRTHCPQGHEYTEENTYRATTGGRVCRECTRVHAREYRARKGAHK